MLSDIKDGLCVGICGGCGILIQDRFYLLAADKQWHVSCLRCTECKTPLDSELTCFARNGNIYCKEDYYRLYSIHRCAKCQIGISSRQLVMRVRESVYHLHCFICSACNKSLNKGEQFGIRDGLIYCRSHYEVVSMDFCTDSNPDFLWDCKSTISNSSNGNNNTTTNNNNNNNSTNNNNNNNNDITSSIISECDKPLVLKGRPRKRKSMNSTDSDDLASNNSDMIMNAELSSSMDSFTYDSSSINSPVNSSSLMSLSLQQQQQQQQQRNKRMRTSFKHHQLRTMKSYFAINQNPDAKDLKQLAQKTGLSKRVLQVWFQNARAKWRRNVMRPETANSSNSSSTAMSTTQTFSSNIGDSSSTINLMQAHHHPIMTGSSSTHSNKLMDKMDDKSECLTSPNLPFLLQDMY